MGYFLREHIFIGLGHELAYEVPIFWADGLTDDEARLVSAVLDPRLADTNDRIRDAERRVTEIDNELATLDGDMIDEAEVAEALADFDELWDCLVSREQARILELLVERVAYDDEVGSISITFRPAGIKALSGELAQRKEEAA